MIKVAKICGMSYNENNLCMSFILLGVTCEPFTVAYATFAPAAGPYVYLGTITVTCISGYVLSDGISNSYTATCLATRCWDAIQYCSSKGSFVFLYTV